MWVIGKNYTKREFVASWPRKVTKLRVPKQTQNLLSIFLPSQFQSKKPKRRLYRESFCPMESTHIKSFKVWDGYNFVKDDTMSVECTMEKIDTIIEVLVLTYCLKMSYLVSFCSK